MKRLIYLAVACMNIATAQTFISTPTVSGTWTTAGSPYIIQNEITVQATDILIIQPGVVVKFQPATRLEVFGQMIAAGTGNNNIVFEAVDTTGWSNELTTAGGWNGIHFQSYGGSGTDNSMMDHCILRDAKYGYAAIYNYMEPLNFQRGMKLYNSTITHCQTSSGMYGSGACLRAQMYITTDTVDIDNCEFSNNIGHPSIISVTNSPGFYRIKKSHIHHNERGSAITALMVNMLIENNEIDHNNSIYDSAPLYITAKDVIIRGNEIHHNVSEDHGGMNCNYGNITVENNFIHNNLQTSASCGLSEGGGGINLTCFGSDINDAFFIVRNNIIANNYSNYGGGGINVYQAIACITNNHIINNDSPIHGKAMFIAHPDSRVYVRNNLFYAQSSPGNIESDDLVYIYSGSWIWFDYNFITANYSRLVNTMFSYTLMGDTIHNVIASNPQLISPTVDNGYLTDAGTANFNIGSSSPCINQGDTVGAFSSTVDYAYNNRFNGTIDIGAYEFGGDQNSGVENYNNHEIPLLVYPNPTESFSTFMVSLPEEKGRLTIVDINGKTVYDQVVSSPDRMINLGPQKGVFFIRFNGSVTATGKIFIR